MGKRIICTKHVFEVLEGHPGGDVWACIPGLRRQDQESLASRWDRMKSPRQDVQRETGEH